MGKLHIVHAMIGVLLLASSASAAIHQVASEHPAIARGHEVADSQLPKAAPPTSRVFSNAMLDPARCNYEYVEMYGTMIVRSELRLTCTTHY